MSDLTGTPVYQDHVRQLETTDPAHPATFNPINQVLINNDAFLIARSDVTGLLGDGMLPYAGSIAITYDVQGRMETIVHRDAGASVIATVTIAYDDINGGRVDYIETVIAAPVAKTIRETFTYDTSDQITGSTRTVI